MKTRKIPSLTNSLLFFMKDQSNFSIEEYEKTMIKLEKKIEQSLIKLLSKVDIQAIVKTDRYSLPYTEEIIYTAFGYSYLNGAFESAPFKRKILTTLLNEDLYKLRFYVFAEIEDHFPMGKVRYCFRYYKH
jgi:hypothetical protein